MKLVIQLEETDLKTLNHIAEARNQTKEDIAKTMIETMIIWLKENHPNHLS